MPESVPPDATAALMHTVLDALYELPLGGQWADVQKALCRYWLAEDDSAETTQLLERHFERALLYLERLPASERQWRNELYRLPVPAVVFTERGSYIDANSAGQKLLQVNASGNHRFGDEQAQKLRAVVKRLNDNPLASVALHQTEEPHLRAYVRVLPNDDGRGQPLYLAALASTQLPDATLSVVAREHGLTKRESQLCMELAAGASLVDVSQSWDVKRSTVKSHLLNSFAKLGVTSQSELVARFLTQLFTSTQVSAPEAPPAPITPFVEPDLHGNPKYKKLTLSDERQLGFFEYGNPDGLPVLYLHGSLDCGLFMRSQQLEQSKVRLIAIERGGVGESTPNPDRSPAAYARDVTELIEALGLRDIVVIGRSMGSWDAIEVARANRSQVCLLTLVSGHLPPISASELPTAAPSMRYYYDAIRRSPVVTQLSLRIAHLQARTRGISTFTPTGIPPLERQVWSDPEFQRHIACVWDRCALFGYDTGAAHLQLYMKPVPNPSWLDTEIPTLMIHGAKDQNVPVERMLEHTKTFKRREVAILPGLGHGLVNVAMREILSLVVKHR